MEYKLELIFQMVYIGHFTLSDLENMPILYRTKMYNFLKEAKDAEKEEMKM
jgi:hypothetical protein